MTLATFLKNLAVGVAMSAISSALNYAGVHLALITGLSGTEQTIVQGLSLLLPFMATHWFNTPSTPGVAGVLPAILTTSVGLGSVSVPKK